MAYREDWVAEILGDRSILECALDVHMTRSGSTERYDLDGQEKDLKVLRHIEENWRPTQFKPSERFDNAVREVIRAAIAECDGQQSLSE